MRKLTCLILSLILSVRISAVPFTRVEDDDVYSCHANSGNKIALTFDDGPHLKYTEEILDILKEFEIKATFFVIGSNAEANPDIIKREIEEGHEIGNHTYSHIFLKKDNYPKLRYEIMKTDSILYEISEYKPRLFRPPGGIFDDVTKEAIKKLEYDVVLWTVDTKDWAHTPAAGICDNVLNNVKSGDIILFHDYVSGCSPTPEALRIIIPKLKEEGFTFVTVSELLGSN